ncbi:hypothetical protein BDV95DRAFT_120070 [Massariosphaeria phaeospora]|uniref:C2H2-type domain-containing protein n=1 Tax=Massariosphaeria phaeospora TaxID=100035 RepID=A0A7C8MB55_9PLEO|nr:hypothetical protein BDV95DRAFT_120070 [Massariosphaeria phaeospora]
MLASLRVRRRSIGKSEEASDSPIMTEVLRSGDTESPRIVKHGAPGSYYGVAESQRARQDASELRVPIELEQKINAIGEMLKQLLTIVNKVDGDEGDVRRESRKTTGRLVRRFRGLVDNLAEIPRRFVRNSGSREDHYDIDVAIAGDEIRHRRVSELDTEPPEPPRLCADIESMGVIPFPPINEVESPPAELYSPPPPEYRVYSPRQLGTNNFNLVHRPRTVYKHDDWGLLAELPGNDQFIEESQNFESWTMPPDDDAETHDEMLDPNSDWMRRLNSGIVRTGSPASNPTRDQHGRHNVINDAPSRYFQREPSYVEGIADSITVRDVRGPMSNVGTQSRGLGAEDGRRYPRAAYPLCAQRTINPVGNGTQQSGESHAAPKGNELGALHGRQPDGPSSSHVLTPVISRRSEAEELGVNLRSVQRQPNIFFSHLRDTTLQMADLLDGSLRAEDNVPNQFSSPLIPIPDSPTYQFTEETDHAFHQQSLSPHSQDGGSSSGGVDAKHESRQDLTRLDQDSGSGADGFECSVCHDSFRTEGSRNKHMNRKHIRRYKCMVLDCGRDFNLNADLNRHKRTVHKTGVDETWRCGNDNCQTPQKVFHRRDNLLRHMSACGNERNGVAG